MSLTAAIAEIVAAYKADPVVSAAVYFPGDPVLGDNVTLSEQFAEWPALVAFAPSGFARHGTAWGSGGAAMRFEVHAVRVEVHDARTDQADVIPRLMALIQPMARVIFAEMADPNRRFGGNVVMLGDPETRAGAAPWRYELRPDNWGGIETVALSTTVDLGIEEGTDG